MQQILGRGGFSTVSLVQLPGGGWVARKSCPQTGQSAPHDPGAPSTPRGSEGPVTNILWALSPQIDAEQGLISFAVEVADRVPVG